MAPKNPSRTKAPEAPSAPVETQPPAGGRPPAVTTEGQRLLRAVAGSLSTVAKQVGASKSTVGDWRTGAKVPSPALRAKLQETYAIPVDAWDRPTGGAASEAAPATETAKPSTLEDVETLIASARASLARDLVSAERVKLTDSLTRLLSLKHRLERDRDTQEDAIVRRHPKWHRIRSILIETLIPFPEAARAVADRLKALEEDP